MNKFPKICHVFLFLTNQCCCCCPYCFEHRAETRMTQDMAFRIVKQLIKNAEEERLIPSICYFGGEPMLEYDTIIKPITEYIRKEYKKPFNLQIITNGVLLNEEKIKFLTDNNVALQLSIDGDRITQEFNRPMKNGQSSHDILANVVPNIIKYDSNANFRATIIPATVKNTYNDLIYLTQLGFKAGFIMPNVFEPWSKMDKDIFAENLRLYTDYIISEFKNEKSPIVLRNYRDAFRLIPQINLAIEQKMFRPEQLSGIKTRCGLCMSTSAAVSYNGELYSCLEQEGNEEFHLGNIFTGIDEDKRNKLIAKWDGSLKLDKCKECKLNRICNYGCVSKNYTLCGHFNIPPDLYCWWENLFLDEAIYMCNAFGDNLPQNFVSIWEEINNGG